MIPRSARSALSGIRHAARRDPLLDVGWYLSQYPDVAESGMDPYRHWRRHGAREGRDPNPFFDADWYLARNPDVGENGMDPLDHFLRFGWKEGRNPSPRFDAAWYLRQNPDVKKSGMNPLVHYLRHGAAEGRQPTPGGSETPIPRSGPGIDRLADGWDVGRIREVIADLLPARARVAVLGAGDADLLRAEGLDAVYFPGGVGRVDGTELKASLSAIAQLETLRAQGIGFLVIPDRLLSWVDERPDLEKHLDQRYAILPQRRAACAIYALESPAAAGDPAELRQIGHVVDEFRIAFAREPTILDWASGLHLTETLNDLDVYSAPADPDGRLPYADATVDLIVVPYDREEVAAEADRVAFGAVIPVGRVVPDEATTVRWRFPERVWRPGPVSIVVATFNGLAYTTTALRSLAETIPPSVDAEIIVVDDGSSEETRRGLEGLAGSYARVSLVVNPANAGYVASANRGAEAAKGELLVFMNDDTIALPGWLPPLQRIFRRYPEAGVVGGMLLHPDGRLQEAGGTVFDDGSGYKFGYGSLDPEADLYAHVREVDYVSGALLATRRDMFQDLGGFDPAYGFGYYEDADYCFKVRRRGLRVYYQPQSVIVHVEGGTAGTALEHGPKQHQALNQVIFAQRWAGELQSHPSRPEEPFSPSFMHALAQRVRTTPAVP